MGLTSGKPSASACEERWNEESSQRPTQLSASATPISDAVKVAQVLDNLQAKYGAQDVETGLGRRVMVASARRVSALLQALPPILGPA